MAATTPIAFRVVPARTDNTHQTRLISRNRLRLPRLIDRVAMIPIEPASLVMERKILEGKKSDGCPAEAASRGRRLGCEDEHTVRPIQACWGAGTP
jgi:hypothetical protein